MAMIKQVVLGLIMMLVATATLAMAAETTLFAPSSVPAIISDTDGGSVELGVRFSSSADGQVLGVRFYKGAENTGAHTGSLWTADGTTRLATATFTNETASGWQEVRFTEPVAITAGTTYVASYHAPNGRYSADSYFFTSDHVNGVLTAPAAGNGPYNYSSTSTFPNQTFQSTNYWVDVVFSDAPSVPDDVAPSVPANLSAIALSYSQVGLTWTESTDNVRVSGYKVYRDGVQIGTSQTAAFTDSGLAGATTYAYRVSAHDPSGNESAQSTSASATTPEGTSFWNFPTLYSHIRIMDFYRGWPWVPDAVKQQVIDWAADHLDLVEWLDLKSQNPKAKNFSYKLDVSVCMHVDCSRNNPLDAGLDSIPEDYFLHFSEPTTVSFSSWGQDYGTITIPGCPEGTPATKSCRMQVNIWNDTRWLFSQANPNFRTWYGDKLVAESVQEGVDGVFLDEHGYGFRDMAAIADGWTKIISGGGIREYAGQGIEDVNDGQYITDLSGALASHSAKLRAVSKFLMPNLGTYWGGTSPTSQITAAGAAYMEFWWRPDSFDENFDRALAFVKNLTDAGAMVALGNYWGYGGPDDYTTGNYVTPAQRYRMWRLAAYYVAKEEVGSEGRVYFDSALKVDYGGPDPLSFMREWEDAYEYDVGTPTGPAQLYQTGPSGCRAPYKIYSRDYTKALMLVRAKDSWDCSNWENSVVLNLQEPMRMLRGDGTLTALMSAVTVRNGEAVIMVKDTVVDPDVTAPTVPQNLAAAAVSASQINLAWSASTDAVGVAGYRIYREGAQVATSPTTTYSDTGLTPATTYNYTVAAYDAAMNVSAQSASASATTDSVVVAPTATLTANPAAIVQGDTSTLTWSSTNANSCDGVGFSTGGTTSGAADVSPEADTTYTLTCTGAGGTDTKTVTVTVEPLVPVVETVFSDGFETALSWTRSGDTTWYTGTPKTCTHSVRLRRTGSIEKVIPLTGYEGATVSFTMGAFSLEAGENVQALYYDGTSWSAMATIANGSVNENNKLNPYTFHLPASVNGLSSFALRFKINGSGTGDYGYVDDVQIDATRSGTAPEPEIEPLCP